MSGVPSDEQLAVLLPIESAVAKVFRANRDLTDHHVMRAYEAASQIYRAEQRGHAPKEPGFSGLDETVFKEVKGICDHLMNEEGISLDLLVDCLRRLMKSVKFHTESGGRQGYVTFVSKFT